MQLLVLAIFLGCFSAAFVKCDPPPCKTPNGEEALCVPLSACPSLTATVAENHPGYTTFLEASKCGHSDSMVCCGTSQQYDKNYVIKHLLPAKTFCGMQHTDDYYYTETATSLDEFPWMIYIPVRSYMKDDPNLEIRCAGALINPKYVLSKSDCATKYFDTVMIGQYNRHQNVSCAETPYGPECTEPAIQIKVASKRRVGQNLLLIRLESGVSYSDYVRPICLPLEHSESPKKGDTIIVSGWGEEEFGGKTLKIKKRIKNTLLDEDECKIENDKEKYPTSDPICIATEKNSSTLICSGDDGGPLMYKYKNNWFVRGVVTGFTPGCFPAEETIRCEGIEGAFDDIVNLMYP